MSRTDAIVHGKILVNASDRAGAIAAMAADYLQVSGQLRADAKCGGPLSRSDRQTVSKYENAAADCYRDAAAFLDTKGEQHAAAAASYRKTEAELRADAAAILTPGRKAA